MLKSDARTPAVPAYVMITPARNEAAFIDHTLRSMVRQTCRPLKWVIVSDGSTDGTDDIVRTYAAAHAWIELVRLPERGQRHFAAKVVAFNAGYDRVRDLPFEVIGNLDGDVSFAEDYLEFLVTKFAEHPELGVTGSSFVEENGVHPDRFKSPDHVPGACQLFRRACFEAIGGYPPVKAGGIDLIAVLAAQAKGWRTRRYDEKACFHHRTVGSGQHANVWRRLLNLGRKDYLLGSHPVFEVFRGAFQMTRAPYILGGIVMLAGYGWALLGRTERCMPEDLIRLRQSDQLRRLKQVLLHPFGTREGGIRAETSR